MKKLLPWLIMIFIVITLVVVAAFIVWNYIDDNSNPLNPNEEARHSVNGVKSHKLSADEIVELTSQIDDITTNLSDENYVVKISFAFQLENKKTKEEFDKLVFLVKSTIIKTLADIEPGDLSSGKGYDALNAKLINLINPILSKGKLEQVDITNIIVSKMQ